MMIRWSNQKLASSNWRRPPGQLLQTIRVLSLSGLVLAVPGSVARAVQHQPEWREEISPAGSVSASASGVPRSDAQRSLDRLGLTMGAVTDPEFSVHGSDGFHGVHEASSDWAAKRLELNGKFAVRWSGRVFGEAMTVTSVISRDGMLTTDDHGGSRITHYRNFPLATCYAGPEGSSCDESRAFDVAWDHHGLIVEFVRDKEGLPASVLFGETLVLRYGFTPPLPESLGLAGDVWREPSSWELVDRRTSEIVIDSIEAAKVASVRPVLSVFFVGFGEMVRVEDGQPFAVFQGARRVPHALVPLDGGSDLWRSVYANGDRSRAYKFRVDYTDDRLRVEIAAGKYGQSIAVEAPRSRESVAPSAIIHPGPEVWTDAMRSGARLRSAVPVKGWLENSFYKASLPIVLWPFANRGLPIERAKGTETVGAHAAAGAGQGPDPAGMAPEFDFGPAEGCEEHDGRIVCLGGENLVIGEETSYPW